MVAEGVVASLARPGGNTTGISLLSPELDGKRQDILIEAVPGALRIGAMAAANAQIGIAYAAYFPTLTLGAQNGFASSEFSTLFNASNHTWSIGPSVSETIFDAGLRGATVRQNVATYNADLAAYRQNVLTAFQQVEDALAQVRIFSQELIQQRQAEQSAQQFLKLEMAGIKRALIPTSMSSPPRRPC